MASDQTIVKEGHMHKWTSEADAKKCRWQSLYFVLHRPSEKNAARLDWYDTQEQFHHSPGMRKALFIEEIKDCTQIPYTRESKELYGPSAKYLLMMQTYRTSIPDYVLMCSSQDLLAEWLDCMRSLLSHVHTLSKNKRAEIPDRRLDASDIYCPNVSGSSSFEVKVDDTSAAVFCELQGVYTLFLSQQHITLADQETGNPIITWMYRHIRRFGYCDKSLTIEGGSKCGIGEGLFIFITDQGQELMNAINDRMQLCKSLQEQDYSYISFKSLKESPSPPAKPKEPSPSAASMYSVVKDKRSTTKSNPNEKPSPKQKPVLKAAEHNGKDALSDQASQPAQPKMSEVLSQLPQQNTQKKEDAVYGYTQLDLKGATARANATADLENPYGEQLVQKIKNSK